MNRYRITSSLLCGAWTGLFFRQLSGPTWAMCLLWFVGWAGIIGAFVLAEVWNKR